MARGRGGSRTPSSPAAVSGPGALSQRTDGGPGQPIRVAPGGDYGDRKASVEQQQAAPLATAGGGAAAPGGQGAAPPVSQDGIFGPTTRPNEPLTAGANRPGPILEANPDLLLQSLAAKYQHPDLIALLNRRGR